MSSSTRTQMMRRLDWAHKMVHNDDMNARAQLEQELFSKPVESDEQALSMFTEWRSREVPQHPLAELEAQGVRGSQKAQKKLETVMQHSYGGQTVEEQVARVLHLIGASPVSVRQKEGVPSQEKPSADACADIREVCSEDDEDNGFPSGQDRDASTSQRRKRRFDYLSKRSRLPLNNVQKRSFEPVFVSQPRDHKLDAHMLRYLDFDVPDSASRAQHGQPREEESEQLFPSPRLLLHEKSHGSRKEYTLERLEYQRHTTYRGSRTQSSLRNSGAADITTGDDVTIRRSPSPPHDFSLVDEDPVTTTANRMNLQQRQLELEQPRWLPPPPVDTVVADKGVATWISDEPHAQGTLDTAKLNVVDVSPKGLQALVTRISAQLQHTVKYRMKKHESPRRPESPRRSM